eukprot:SAG22_NODE_151_length_17414_cov_7.812128_15_plen_54_part_00
MYCARCHDQNKKYMYLLVWYMFMRCMAMYAYAIRTAYPAILRVNLERLRSMLL